MVSGIAALGGIAAAIDVGEVAAGLWLMVTIALMVCALSIHQAVTFSPAVLARLERLADRTGGRFTPWRTGVGDNTAHPFTESAGTDCFAVVNYVDQGVAVEVGHLSTHKTAGLRKLNAYVAIRLPRRVPHLVVDFGHLRQILGVRVVPTSWHRSQRVDVGGGRRFPLFVADGGEQFARTFFTPDVVRAFRAVGRSYDVEIRGDRVYLLSRRSIASGSERRLQRQRELVDDLVLRMSDPRMTDFLSRQRRDLGRGELRTDVKRGVILVGTGAVVVIAVLSGLLLRAEELLGS
ncbi:hypothetical protein RDV89_01095 [Nocardioides zeae]|uniref:Uncharacterized protein n=1 Tax=Nocardioides imazamoxiresistens TaxID=3231893 RepID=A0ABU3PR08_9ACTN|nr:hypothetical protein [Nocardioides zeae]MDT9591643.1 hypothetical protein [Nocardioides zeae]